MIKRIFIYVVIIFLVIMGILVHCRFVSTKGLVTKEYVVNNNMFDNIKIVHISDILYNEKSFKEDIDKIVDEIDLIEPDIIVFTGDLVSKNYKLNSKDKKYLIDIFNSMDSTYGKYSILGDNDYNDLATIKDIYLNSNFTLLDNEYDTINIDNKLLFIGGVSSYNKDEADIDAIMNYFNDHDDIEYKLILVHEPDYIDKIIPKYNIDLIFGGHSLNGQVNFPIIKNVFLQRGSRKYYKNYYKNKDTDIYISSGIGVIKSNFRFNNKPSINFYRFTLK